MPANGWRGEIDVTEDETTQREKKARKIHKCAECKCDIDAGSIYVASSLKIGGRYEPIARHRDCLSFGNMIADELMTEDGYRLFIHAGLKTRDISDLVLARGKAFPAVIERLKDRRLL